MQRLYLCGDQGFKSDYAGRISEIIWRTGTIELKTMVGLNLINLRYG